MHIRAFAKEDYATICDWWDGHGHARVAYEALPQTGALAIDSKDQPVAASFLYLTNTSLAYLAWTVSNPDIRPRQVHSGITEVIAHLVELAYQLDFQTVVSTSNSRGLSRILKKSGMNDTGKHDLLLGQKG